MQVILTYHGEERIRKRKGTSKKNAKRAAEEALTHGLKYSDITNLNLRKFMDGKYFQWIDLFPLKGNTLENVAKGARCFGSGRSIISSWVQHAALGVALDWALIFGF